MTTEAAKRERDLYVQVRADLMRAADKKLAWVVSAFVVGCLVGGLVAWSAMHDRAGKPDEEPEADSVLEQHTEQLWKEHEERDASLDPKPRVR